jgi:chemotaxis response regulator CheB
MPTSRIRVAVVEDDSRLRRTFTDILESADDRECVGVFSTGEQAVARIPPLEPDVIIMDLNLPDSSGVECVAALGPQLPATQILMVTVYQDPEQQRRFWIGCREGGPRCRWRRRHPRPAGAAGARAAREGLFL